MRQCLCSVTATCHCIGTDGVHNILGIEVVRVTTIWWDLTGLCIPL